MTSTHICIQNVVNEEKLEVTQQVCYILKAELLSTLASSFVFVRFDLIKKQACVSLSNSSNGCLRYKCVTVCLNEDRGWNFQKSIWSLGLESTWTLNLIITFFYRSRCDLRVCFFYFDLSEWCYVKVSFSIRVGRDWVNKFKVKHKHFIFAKAFIPFNLCRLVSQFANYKE